MLSINIFPKDTKGKNHSIYYVGTEQLMKDTWMKEPHFYMVFGPQATLYIKWEGRVDPPCLHPLHMPFGEEK